MDAGKLGRIGGSLLALGLVGCVAIAPAAEAGKTAKKSKNVTKTFTKGAGGSLGGVQTAIPDGAGEHDPARPLRRSSIKGLNPRGKIVDVNVGVRATHPQATDLEFYLATPARRDQPDLRQRRHRQQLRRRPGQLRRTSSPCSTATSRR